MESNNIEKHIKDKLEDYAMFEGDQMAIWTEVEKALQQKKKRRFFWFFLFGFALVLISGFYAWNTIVSMDNSNNNADQLTNTILLPENKISAVESISNNNPIDTEPFPVNDLENSANNEDNLQVLTVKSAIPPDLKIQQLNPTNAPIVQEKSFFNISANPTTLHITGTETVNGNKVESNENGIELLKSTPIAEQYISAVQPKGNLPFLPRLDFFINDKMKNLEMASSPIEEKPTILIKNQKLWSISIGAGSSKKLMGFANSSPYSNLRSDTETPLYSWSIGLDISRKLKNNFQLATGLAYTRDWTRFDYNEITTGQEVVENVLISYSLDLLNFTDTTEFIYGNALVETQTKKEVKHYNRSDFLKIPILIGKEFEMGPLSFTIFSGLGVLINRHRSGRYLNIDGNINTFNTPSSSNLGFSFELKGMAKYQVSDKFSLFLQPNASFSITDRFQSDPGYIEKPIFIGLKGGVSLSF